MTVAARSFRGLKPCIDDKGHEFRVSTPPPGAFGYALTYCTRCGFFHEDLRAT